MKVGCKTQAAFCLFGILVFLANCKAIQIVENLEQKAIKVEEKQSEEKTADSNEPKIVFDSKVYDFGNLGVKKKAKCEFKFKNTGQSLLKIGKIKATCGCTAPSLSKKEYKPGEEGIIKITYSGQDKPGTVAKHIYVSTNEKGNSKVKLTIKAKVIQLIEVIPPKLQFSWNKENAGSTNITIKSKEGKNFSIKSFSASKNVVEVEFDPNAVASEFILRPKINMQKLKKCRKGNIRIKLTHPQCSDVTIPYEVPAKFQCQPTRIILHNVEPNKPQIEEMLIKNIIKGPFEIESISSKEGCIKIILQQQDNEHIRLKLQITPPPVGIGAKYFSDDLFIKIKNDEKLTVNCSGFYRRKLVKGEHAE